MDNAQLVSEIKQLLGNAETEKALGRLIGLLQSSPKYRNLNSLALQARARFRKAQQDELQGLASGEAVKLTYNQVTRQALQIVEWLEEGKLDPEVSSAESSPGRWPWVMGALVLLIAIAGGGYWWWAQSQAQEPGEELSSACHIDRQFEKGSEFNILLVPFQVVAGEPQKPHALIAARLESFIKEYNINCDFGTLLCKDSDSFLSIDDATRLAKEFEAQLIIWGTAESSPQGSTINTNYKFLKKKGKDESNLELSKLELSEGSQLATVSTLSSIATSGILTQAIEKSIRLLFGLIAHEAGDASTAIEMLEGYQPSDSTAHLVKGMVLAEDYLANKQEDKAWESYNEVLAVHPDYALARNNRGVLNLKKGNYTEAAEDLTVFLKKDSSNVKALEARSEAYLKADQLKQAREDLLKVKKMRPPDRTINQRIEEVDKKIEEEKKAKASAEAELQANPNNLAAWNQKAISSHRLGDFAEAVKAGEAILQRDPDNKEAFTQIIKAYRSANDTTQVKKWIQKAEDAGIAPSQLEGVAPTNLNRIQLPSTRFDLSKKN